MYTKLKNINMNISTTTQGGSFDPEIFGPPFWFTLHNAAVAYFDKPTLEMRTMMKRFIMSIPIIVPCDMCRKHSYDYIQAQETKGLIDKCVSDRSQLFQFFLDFHNYVNSKKGSPLISLEDAQLLYGYFRQGNPSTITITYT